MNNHKRIQEAIDSRLAGLSLDEGFINKKAHRAQTRHSARRPLATVAVICLCLALALPVMAATIPAFNHLLSVVSPEIAQKLQPIAMVSESNGIKMEVVAAMNDDDAAVVYVTMKDLIGSRIDRTINLYDDYHITGASGFTSDVVDFDEKTGTATLRIQAFGGSKLDGQKVTLHINSFVSGKHVFDDLDSGIELKNIMVAPTADYDMDNSCGGGGDLYNVLKKQGKIKVLKPDAKNLRFPAIDFLEISNIGMVDGRLHIQVKWKEQEMNNGYLYLIDDSGKTLYPTTVSLDSDSSGIGGSHQDENIFEIAQSDVAKYRLKGYFQSYDRNTKGDWQTTFKIDAVAKAKQASCNITKGSLEIDSVTVSPLGITLKGSDKPGPRDLENGSNQLQVSAITDSNATISKFDSTNCFNENGKVTIKYLASSPLDSGKIKAVVIDGHKVEFKE